MKVLCHSKYINKRVCVCVVKSYKWIINVVTLHTPHTMAFITKMIFYFNQERKKTRERSTNNPLNTVNANEYWSWKANSNNNSDSSSTAPLLHRMLHRHDFLLPHMMLLASIQISLLFECELENECELGKDFFISQCLGEQKSETHVLLLKDVLKKNKMNCT